MSVAAIVTAFVLGAFWGMWIGYGWAQSDRDHAQTVTA